jgi:hypothetical protein
MPNFQGVWSLSEQYQAIGSQNWPMAPGAPTGVSASAGDAQATVSFTAPSFTGVPPGVTQYRAISDPGGVTRDRICIAHHRDGLVQRHQLHLLGAGYEWRAVWACRDEWERQSFAANCVLPLRRW